jgi:hypothetical protein
MPLTLEFTPRLMPAPQAAHYLGVSMSTILTLDIPRKELGRKRLYDRIDLDAYADTLATEGESAWQADEAFG